MSVRVDVVPGVGSGVCKANLQAHLHDAGEAGLFTSYEVATLLNAFSDPRRAAKKLIWRVGQTYLSQTLALGVESGVFLAEDAFTLLKAARNRSEVSPRRLLGYISSWEVTRHATLVRMLAPVAI